MAARGCSWRCAPDLSNRALFDIRMIVALRHVVSSMEHGTRRAGAKEDGMQGINRRAPDVVGARLCSATNSQGVRNRAARRRGNTLAPRSPHRRCTARQGAQMQ